MAHISLSFSYQVANKVRAHFAYLSGLPFASSGEDKALSIQSVCVIPWDSLNQWLFLREYEESRNLNQALEQQMLHHFDVGVLTQVSAFPMRVKIKTLSAYLNEMNRMDDLAALNQIAVAKSAAVLN